MTGVNQSPKLYFMMTRQDVPTATIVLDSRDVAIPQATWELAQIEIHNLRQLVGVVRINCQLAQRNTLTCEEAVQRNLKAIADQQATQFQAFRNVFASIDPGSRRLSRCQSVTGRVLPRSRTRVMTVL